MKDHHAYDQIYQFLLDALESLNRVEATPETRRDFKKGVSDVHEARRGVEELRKQAKLTAYQERK